MVLVLLDTKCHNSIELQITNFSGRRLGTPVMWRLSLRLSRSFSTTLDPLKEHSAYLAKLATRKPPPILLETDLEESFIKGTSP
jgi:hypothetical protein